VFKSEHGHKSALVKAVLARKSHVEKGGKGLYNECGAKKIKRIVLQSFE
jgi:hypothetical protein